jgi:hypothetical protein
VCGVFVPPLSIPLLLLLLLQTLLPSLCLPLSLLTTTYHAHDTAPSSLPPRTRAAVLPFPWAHVLRTHQQGYSDDLIQKAFKDLDLNEDHKIDASEFVTFKHALQRIDANNGK